MVKFFKSNLFFFLLLTAVVFSLYGRSIFFDYTCHDDNSLIVDNMEFLSDIKNVPKVFETSAFFFKESPYYRPILSISFMFEAIFFKGSVHAYHFTNIILFIAAVYLMYVFLSKLNLNKTILKFLCLLTAVHPVFASTVVWIPSRNDTLLAIFIYLSFIFFINYLKFQKTKDFILYIMFWALSLFTKEPAVFAPFLYALFVYCFDYKLNKKEIIKNISVYIPILFVYFLLRKMFVLSIGIEDHLLNLPIYIKNFADGMSLHISKIFMPVVPLVMFNIKLGLKEISFDVILAVFLIFVLYKRIVGRKIFLFAAAWFLTFISTTFLMRDYVYFNHRLTIPILGVIMVLAVFLDYIIKEYKNTGKYLAALFIFLFLFFSVLSFIHEGKFINRYIYWINAYYDAPTYHVTSYNLGRLYMEQGDFSKAKEFIIKANELNERKIYLSDLALVYYFEGDINKAEDLFKLSVKYINSAQSYRNLSVIYYKRDNDIDKAIEYAKYALNEDPFNYSYKKYLQFLIDEKNKTDNNI